MVDRKKSHLILICFIIFVLAFYFINIFTFYIKPIKVSEDFEYTVEQGTTFKKVIDELSLKEVINLPLSFRFFTLLHGKTTSLKAGDYKLNNTDTAYSLLKKFSNGDTIHRSFVIVPGWNFSQLKAAVDASPYFKHTINDKNNTEIADLLGVEQRHLEGLFLPDTYHFASGIKDTDFLKLAFQAMEFKLDKLWEASNKTSEYNNKYDVLILASIIEKETSLSDEYKKIAGIFIKRLKKGMRLQADPSVIYGIKDFKGPLTKSDLKSDSPYNTYTRFGLPPTPIAMPSLAAIEAALHPDLSDALYFVADGSGGHVFSKNLSEHLIAVSKYRSIKMVSNNNG